MRGHQAGAEGGSAFSSMLLGPGAAVGTPIDARVYGTLNRKSSPPPKPGASECRATGRVITSRLADNSVLTLRFD